MTRLGTSPFSQGLGGIRQPPQQQAPSGGLGGWAPQGFSLGNQNNQPQTPVQQEDARINAMYGTDGGKKWSEMQKQLALTMRSGVLGHLSGLSALQPQQLSMIQQAMAALNPANRMGRVDSFRRDAQGSAADMARQSLGQFQGLTPELANAIRLGAMNQAAGAGNDFMMKQYSPEMDAQSAMLAGQLMDPGAMANLYFQILNGGRGQTIQDLGQRNAGANAAMTGLAGIAGAAAGFMPGARAAG